MPYQPKDWEKKISKKIEDVYKKGIPFYKTKSTSELAKMQWKLIENKLLASAQLESLRINLAEKEGVEYKPPKHL